MYYVLILSRLVSLAYSFTLRDAFFNETTPEEELILDAYWKINGRLYKQLFKDYIRQLPAIWLSDRNDLPDRPVNVNTTLMYARMLQCDQARQSVTMILDFSMEWIDPRLVWNASDFNGISTISMMKKETVYIPDALPFDTISYTDILPEEQQYLNLDYDGSIFWYKSAIFEYICTMNLKDFPFDTQKCDLQLTSYNFYIPEMTITGFLDAGVIPLNAGNGEWTVLNITVTNSQLPSNDGPPYAYVYYTFTMKRATTYYIVMMIIPSFILTLLCVLGLFWTRVTAECYMENLELGFAAILAMMFVLQMVTSDMPKISETDRLSRFLMCNLAIITLASVVVMVLGKSHKAKKKKGEMEKKESCTKLDCMISIVFEKLNVVLILAFCTAAVANIAVLFG